MNPPEMITADYVAERAAERELVLRLANERHPTSPWEVKLVAEKRWKRPFHRFILPFATKTI
jgi:hypothetical protein